MPTDHAFANKAGETLSSDPSSSWRGLVPACLFSFLGSPPHPSLPRELCPLSHSAGAVTFPRDLGRLWSWPQINWWPRVRHWPRVRCWQWDTHNCLLMWNQTSQLCERHTEATVNYNSVHTELSGERSTQISLLLILGSSCDAKRQASCSGEQGSLSQCLFKMKQILR